MKIILASGPVVIEDEKVLLNREKKDYGTTPWLFPGGKAEPGETDPEIICKREIAEEMGIKIEIIKKLKTLEGKSFSNNKDKKYILHHYLAKRIGDIKPANNIIEWGWYDIDNLPNNCAPNVYEIIKDYKNNNK